MPTTAHPTPQALKPLQTPNHTPSIPAELSTHPISLCLSCLWKQLDFCALAYHEQLSLRVVVQNTEQHRWLVTFAIPRVAIRAWAEHPRQTINLHDWGYILHACALPSAASTCH